MARKKIQADMVAVNSLDGADRSLAEIAEYQRQIDQQTAKMNEQIDALKAEYAEALEPVRKYISRLEAGLTAYAESNKDTLFSRARSLDLTYGRIGYRKSTTLKTLSKVTWKDVLAALKRRKDKRGIRVKEEVDKDELHTWDDAQLEKVGVERKIEDGFFYEIEEVDIANTEARGQ